MWISSLKQALSYTWTLFVCFILAFLEKKINCCPFIPMNRVSVLCCYGQRHSQSISRRCVLPWNGPTMTISLHGRQRHIPSRFQPIPSSSYGKKEIGTLKPSSESIPISSELKLSYIGNCINADIFQDRCFRPIYNMCHYCPSIFPFLSQFFSREL